MIALDPLEQRDAARFHPEHTDTVRDVGPFMIAKVVFPLFGLGFIAFGIFSAMSAHQAAQNYRSAKKKYQRRRAELMRDD